MLKEGTYEARAINAGLSQTKKGDGQAFIEFEVTHPEGGTDHITYFGGLGEKSAEYTAKALVTAGFVANDFEDLKKDFIQTFSPNTVSIQVKEEEYQGKKMMKVKWVNKLSQGPKKFEGQAPKMAAVFAKVRTELGVKPAASTEGW